MHANRRFLLIDPALVSTVGHHYDFARNVLNAASDAGFTPLLASHKARQLNQCGEFEILPAFRDGLFTHQSGSFSLRGLGYATSILRRAGSMASRLAAATASLRERLRGKRFAEDTSQLLKALRPRPEDLIFVPNATRAEVLGLARLLMTCPHAHCGSWHLEFHFDALDRSTGNQKVLASETLRWQRALRLLRLSAADCRVSLWTDTDVLTAQYNALATSRFATLPIPVGGAIREAATQAAQGPLTHPLTVVYLGDARAEKGYARFPELLRLVWRDLVDTGRAQFVLQSNFRSGRSEPASVQARKALSALAAPQIELLTSSLSSAGYTALLSRADIVLIPYDQSAYEARSSGILAEALAAGRPVVVPSGTWMARQIETSAVEVPDSHPAGVVYDGSTAGLASALVRLVIHFERYRRAAAELARLWGEQHNSNRLVERLVESSRWPHEDGEADGRLRVDVAQALRRGPAAARSAVLRHDL